MRLGIALTAFDFPSGPAAIGREVTRIARQADGAGFDSLWAMDHFFQIEPNGPEEDPMLEVYTLLGFLAGVTKRIRLGAMVTGVIYRFPAVLVKQVSTLDVLSGGRAYFGIGAAWNRSESDALDIPFPSMRERFELLERQLQLAHAMFERDDPMNHPQPCQQPHPPILIGGGGERKTLRFVARYGDACNLGEGDEIPHKLDVLRRHCEAEGRDYAEIEKTSGGHIEALDRDDLLRRAERQRERGIQHWILEPHRRPWDERTLEFLGELAPLLRQ